MKITITVCHSKNSVSVGAVSYTHLLLKYPLHSPCISIPEIRDTTVFYFCDLLKTYFTFVDISLFDRSACWAIPEYL